jgi:outer membrane protein TolC
MTVLKILRSRTLRAFGIGLLCASPAVPWASVSLAEMVAAAAERNPGQDLARAEREIAGSLQRKADHPFAADPSVNVKYQTDALGSDLGYREWEGGIDFPLRLPGQSGAYALEADVQKAVAESMSNTRRLEIAGEVRERMWAVAIAGSEFEQAASALAVARKLLNDVRRRVEAGELPRSDRLLAEKELLWREEEMQQAVHRATLAQRLFSRYTGLEAPAQPALEQPVSPRELDAEHPRLRLAQRRTDAARTHLDRVRSTSCSGPNLWLGAKSTKAADDFDHESSIGVELSMPIGTGAHTAPEVAEAEAALTRAQVAQRALRLELEDGLTRASLDLDRTATTREKTERRMTLAEETLKLSRRAFDLGETDLVHLLRAQGDALGARYDYRIRTLEYGRAVARLNQALGVIPE